MDLQLNGKVALVTGGARDVGREIVLALADEGAAVAVNYRGSEAQANELVAEIEGRGGQARAYGADVTDYDAVRGMVDGIAADLGGLDILVNNAGYVTPHRFRETTPEEWHQQIDVGLYGVIHCCHAAVEHLAAGGAGRIVNLAGDSARVGEVGLSITAASRGGVLALTKTLAKELGRDGITVNAIALGLVETSHSDAAWLEKHMAKIVRNYPTGRIGQPNDVAPTVAFLASGGAAWVTGQIISVSGGYSMVG
ncbi:MAG: SDR family oxidoreductase [Alphaproteobacteria bacterium]|jgi:NAD(P)-dependent dehydrogenase (short-subunit alcohol dehydrogenase family)|nr:SDR family oxidoreductase [Alphaproteobacteria bacterium]